MEKKEYYLYVKGKAVPVSEEVYKAYWKITEHEKYLQKKDWKYGVIPFSSFYMKGLQGVAEIENNDSKSKGLQAVAQFDERVINHIKQIPWGHNQRIINKCKTIDEAIYYVNKTIENGWSRNVLEHQIESGLYGREGKSITNFEKRLPALQSDLARQTLKDPYHFDFLTIREGSFVKDTMRENYKKNWLTRFLIFCLNLARDLPILAKNTT